MKLPFLIPLAKMIRAHCAGRREPDLNIGPDIGQDVYMRRWYVLPRNKYFCLYLHQFMRSDDDRALHDHPAHNLSFVFDGEYTEHLPGDVRLIRRAGQVVWRKATAAHRIELHAGPCWTLFVFTYKFRGWGFLCGRGWVPQEQFIHENGCGEE